MKNPLSFISRRCFLKSAGALAACGLAGGLVPLPAFAGQGRDEAAPAQQTRLLMGTLVTLTALAPDPARADAAFARAFAEMERLIAVFDRRNAASALSVLNAEGSLSAAPPELLAVLRESDRLGRETEFAFNPAVAPVLELFEAARSASGGTASARPIRLDDKALAEALDLAKPGGIRRADGGAVRLERGGMRLTLDGIAKGYIADAASRSLTADGLANHMVNAGGDIRASGFARSGRPWSVGIQDPDHPNRIVAGTSAVNCGIATSGSYENYFDRSHSQHHLISHLTGKSPDMAGITVKAPTAMQADALATALALLPPAQAVRYVNARANVACLIIGRQGQQYSSANWS